MIRSAARRVVGLLARRWPQGLYGGAEHVARLTAPLTRQRAAARRLEQLLPHLDHAEAQRAARHLRCSLAKSWALGVVLSSTRDDPVFPPVAVDAAFADLRGPAILATFHVDAVGVLGDALRQVPGEVVALHRMGWTLPGNVLGLYVDHTEIAGAAAFYRALATLRRLRAAARRRSPRRARGLAARPRRDPLARRLRARAHDAGADHPAAGALGRRGRRRRLR
jgi:hypothetical protein